MKKIFLYIHSIHIGGGAENVLYDLAIFLKKCGWQVSVCAMVNEEPSFQEQLEEHDIQVFRLDLGRDNFVFKIFKLGQLVNILRQEKPDILISWLWPAVVTGDILGRLAGIKTRIANLRGPALHKTSLKVWLDRILAARYTGYIAVSESVKIIFSQRERFDQAKIQVISNGLDTDAKRTHHDVSQINRELNIRPDHFVFGSVGRLYPEKNQQLLIKAAKLLKERGLQFKLVLVGGGPQELELRNEIAASYLEEEVILTGWQEDIYKYLNIIEVFVLPSLYEGLPSSILQAWLLKKTVVATKVSGIKDLVVDGKNGLLFDANSAHQLANILLNLSKLPQLRHKLAENGYNTLMEHYTLDKMHQNYLNYLKS